MRHLWGAASVRNRVGDAQVKNRLCKFFRKLQEEKAEKELADLALWAEGMEFMAFSPRDYADLTWGPIVNPKEPDLDPGEDFGIIRSKAQKKRLQADHPQFGKN